jgi:hypothetical protein
LKLTLKLVTRGPTDRPTDQPTDIVRYRAAIAAKNTAGLSHGSPGILVRDR